MRTPSPTRWPVFVALVLFLAPLGCSTIGDDLSDLGDSLTPVSPPEAARMMVDPYDPDNRRRGTVLISNSPFGGSDAYLTLYRDRAKYETDPLVRAASLAALGRYGQPEDGPLIAASLSHEKFQVRWEAAKALQRIHNPDVVRDLLRVIANIDEDVDIRIAAAIALGQYPQDRVFQGLVAALDVSQLAINVAARQSLETLTGQDFGFEATDWLRWYSRTTGPFANQQEYLFPTYSREQSFFEKLAFWSSPNFEKPAAPAGLESATRKTYQDDEPGDHEAGG